MLSAWTKSKSVMLGLAICLATVAFTQWGYFWYAMLLDDVWQELIGRNEDELIALAEHRGWIQSFNTWFISLVQVCGLMALIYLSRAKSFFEHQIIAGICSVFIALPVLGNAVLFAGQSTQLWALDFIHFILGYAGIAMVFWICLQALPNFVEDQTRSRNVQKRIQSVIMS